MELVDRARIAGSNVHYARLSLAAFAAAQRQLGVSSVEVYGSTPHVWCDREGCGDLSGTRRSLAEAGLRVTAFAPRNYGYSLCAGPDSLQGEASMAYYRGCIDAASLLSAPRLVLVPAGRCLDQPFEAAAAHCREALVRLCALAGERGLVVTLGQTAREDPGVTPTLESLAAMLDRVGAPNLRALLDTAVMAAAGESVAQWAAALGERIALVRFVDGRNDGRRTWGEGCIPCGSTLEALQGTGYRGPLSLFLAGERFALDPASADRRNLVALERFLGDGGG